MCLFGHYLAWTYEADRVGAPHSARLAPGVARSPGVPSRVLPLSDQCLQILSEERGIDVAAHPIRVYLTPPGVCGFIGQCRGCKEMLCSGARHLQARLPRNCNANMTCHSSASSRPGVCWLRLHHRLPGLDGQQLLA